MARTGDRRNAYSVLAVGFEGRGDLEDIGLCGSTMLEWFYKKWDGKAWAGLFWLRTGTSGGLFECGNENPGFMICGEFLD